MLFHPCSWSHNQLIQLTYGFFTPVPGEFDGSLSRNDLYFGDNHSFNQTIWNTVAAHFHHDTISIPVAARARLDRVTAAEAINPNFTASNVTSFGTSALYLQVMRGQYNATKTKYVQIFFRESRSFLRGAILKYGLPSSSLLTPCPHRRRADSLQ